MARPYRVLIHVPADTACEYYRSILPHRHCARPLAKEGIELVISPHINLDDPFDCYVFHRYVGNILYPVVLDLKRSGKRIVWDLDDNVYKIPEWSPSFAAFDGAAMMFMSKYLEEADTLTVTTDRFRKQLAGVFREKRIDVLPNLVDAEDFHFGKAMPTREKTNDPFRFLWAGSISHGQDIGILVEPIKRMIARYGNKVHFVFVGLFPNEFSNSLSGQFTFINGCELRYYYNFLSLLQPDCAFTPLVECEFNEAKSAIKYFEMAMIGAPVLSSDCGPYKDVIASGRDGYLVRDGDEWLGRMVEMYSDAATRRTVAEAARAKVRDEFSWGAKAKASLWLDFFRSLAA